MDSERAHLAKQLDVVSQIASVSSASLGLEDLNQVIYDAVAPYFDHESYSILRYFKSRNRLQLFFGVENGEVIQGEEIPLGGFSGVVIQEQAPLYIPDVNARDASLPDPIVRGTNRQSSSWLGVPLRVRNQPMGVLSIAAKDTHAYGDQDIQLLATVADQLAVAIENARLFESTRAQAERLALLNRVSRAVSTTLDLDSLLDALYKEISPAFDHDGFLVVLNREATQELEMHYGVLDGVRVMPERHPFGGLVGVVVGERKTLHVRNYAEEKDRLPTPYLTPEETTSHDSWLGVPLIVGERVLGALCIMKNRPHAFSNQRVRLFETLADQIAFAISNAENFRSIRDAANRLGVVNRIGRVVARETDLRKLAEAIYLEIAPIFEATTFFVALHNESDETIEFPFIVDEGERIELGPLPFGEGLTSTVLRTKKMLHIRDEEEYVRVIGDPALYGSMKVPATWLGIPLVVEGNVIGVINVQSYVPNAYSDDQALLLSTIADQIAMSFERARLHRASQHELEERKRAEESLAEERTLLRTIIDNIPDFIYAKDMEGRFVVANTTLAQFFGYEKPEDILGKSLVDLFPDEVATGYRDEERDILETGDPVLNKEEHVVNRSMEELRWLLVSKLPLINAQGQIIGLAGIDRDVTARKHAEEEVKRYLAEVEVANEEVKQFAYIVSHDLRAPLVNLKGFSAELKDSMEALAPHLQKILADLDESEREELVLVLDEDIPEALGFIETSVSRMDGFINSVLKLSRIGRRELAKQPVKLAEFVETCRQSLAHQMEEKGVELIVGDLPEVVADPTALEQIIGNLLTNAVNYLSPDRPGRIEIGGEPTALATKFWVKDNGRGISEDDEEKVFAPFRRAGKQDVKGEGMGLSYVRTMVRQHGGQIWFESDLDVGTTFFFTIANQ